MGRAGLSGVRAFVLAVVTLVPATAAAHAYIMQPPSRDVGEANLDARAKKFGPCGGSPRTNTPTQYEVGAEIEVKFEETIGHTGCYQIAFSPADDKDWVTLLQVNDPAGRQNVQTATVKLPAGVSCKDCTLVVRQLMFNRACEPDAAPNSVSAGDTYFSCADIRVGDFPDAGPTMPPPDGGVDDDEDDGNSSGGVSTTPTDGGGDTSSSGGGRRLTPVDSGDSGCSVALGATSSFSLCASLGFGALALVRRRRRAQR
ncbi:MAG: lytic polysaccharide monooxygenase [Labilithrix sp.]|nr:lytic polysaccharide monooxygenase [Labilithrix sp.]